MALNDIIGKGPTGQLVTTRPTNGKMPVASQRTIAPLNERVIGALLQGEYDRPDLDTGVVPTYAVPNHLHRAVDSSEVGTRESRSTIRNRATLQTEGSEEPTDLDTDVVPSSRPVEIVDDTYTNVYQSE